MKKLLTIALIALLGGSVFAVNVATELDIDMADHGTTVIITNSTASAMVMGDVLITYDTSSSNTIYFDVTLDSGVTYRLGSDTVTSGTYSDARDLIPRKVNGSGRNNTAETWTITTTETNVNLRISFNRPE